MRKRLHLFVRWLFKVFMRLDVTGLENVPRQGGCLLAANHLSRLDPALVYVLVEREDLTALVANKYLKNPFFRWLVELFGGIWINRGEADLQALRLASNILKEGGALGVAPEGTRSKTGGLIPARTGVAYLAEKSGAPVIPTAIWGTEKALGLAFLLQRPWVHVRMGKPFILPPLDPKDRSASLKQNTDEIMCQIAAMLPPQYRGVYADHPRLKEILGVEIPAGELAQVPASS